MPTGSGLPPAAHRHGLGNGDVAISVPRAPSQRILIATSCSTFSLASTIFTTPWTYQHVVADQGVDGIRHAPRTAEQFVDRLPERFPFQVPKGDIDRRKCPVAAIP